MSVQSAADSDERPRLQRWALRLYATIAWNLDEARLNLKEAAELERSSEGALEPRRRFYR